MEPRWPCEPFVKAMCPDQTFLLYIDEELSKAWCIMRNFCTTIKLAAKGGMKLTERTLLDIMSSVMYRLLHMKLSIGSLDEAIRLGLLIFCSDIFLQWEGARSAYLHLSVAYRNCLGSLELIGCTPPNLMIWLLTVAAISIDVEEDQRWLMPHLLHTLKRSDIRTWDDAHDKLSAFLWIDWVFNVRAKALFDPVFLSSNSS